jgi:hypothetical protein
MQNDKLKFKNGDSRSKNWMRRLEPAELISGHIRPTVGLFDFCIVVLIFAF